MTDQTESTHAALLRDLDSAAAGIQRLDRLDAESAAAAIRALEAKVRELETLHQHALRIVYQTCDDEVARQVDRVEALAAEVELLRTQAGLPPKYPTSLVLHDADANMVNADLRADRDRLAGENERLRNQAPMGNGCTCWSYTSQEKKHADNCVLSVHAAEVARLTSELAEARGDSARVDALQSMLRAVDFDFEDTGESVLMFTLPANVRVGMNLRATVDAARRAGEGEK